MFCSLLYHPSLGSSKKSFTRSLMASTEAVEARELATFWKWAVSVCLLAPGEMMIWNFFPPPPPLLFLFWGSITSIFSYAPFIRFLEVCLEKKQHNVKMWISGILDNALDFHSTHIFSWSSREWWYKKWEKFWITFWQLQLFQGH